MNERYILINYNVHLQEAQEVHSGSLRNWENPLCTSCFVGLALLVILCKPKLALVPGLSPAAENFCAKSKSLKTGKSPL